MKIRFLGKFCRNHLLTGIVLIILTRPLFAAGETVFDIATTPNPRTWKAFHQSSEDFRSQLWRSYWRQGKRLKDWAWQWRLGWLRRCALSSELYCGDIFEQGLKDPAMVVRAEAATLLGRRFANSHHRQAFDLLRQAYRNPSNRREGEPLFIQYRILAALYSIAPNWQDKISRIAGDSRKTRDYLAKLSR